jgi:hypothetical protein
MPNDGIACPFLKNVDLTRPIINIIVKTGLLKAYFTMSNDTQTTIKARDRDSLLVSKERSSIWQKLKGKW